MNTFNYSPKKLKTFANGEVRIWISNGKRGFYWAKTVELKCPECGVKRIIPKKKLEQYTTDYCKLHYKKGL